MSTVLVRGIDKSYGSQRVLRDITLQFRPGEFVSLLGPSGCGKTTLLRVIAGLERADRGEILLNGTDIGDVPPNRRDMGMVFQAYSLFPNMTASENVAFGLAVRGRAWAARDRRVAELLELVGLSAFGARYPHQLSGGQQQRVALARALAIDPALLLLDEPLSALDAKVRVELREEIRRIQKETGVTTVFVAHDQEEALSISDRVAVMSKGVVDQFAEPIEIYQRPARRFVVEFIGASSRLPGTVVDSGDGGVAIAGARFQSPAAIGMPAGHDVSVYLRPEDVALTPADASSNGALRGRVTETTFMARPRAWRSRTGPICSPMFRPPRRRPCRSAVRSASNGTRRAHKSSPGDAPAHRRTSGTSGPITMAQQGFEQALLEHLPVGVLLIDCDGVLEVVNPAARRLFGGGAGPGLSFEALRAPRLLDAIRQALEASLASSCEVTLTRGQTQHLACRVVPLPRDPVLPGGIGGSSALVFVEDRTQSRLAEELRRDFIANASHELKTPLTAICGILETLEGHARDDPRARDRFVSIMAGQAERMRRLVDDLLSLNRIELNERVHPEAPQPLAQVVREVADTLAPLARNAGMRLVVLPFDGDPVVAGDRGELSQVFFNIIENALRYGRPGPEVRVRFRFAAGERPRRIGVDVEDDGPGIAGEHIPRLTERFYRVSVIGSRAVGGTGLGLAIVKHILLRHRGRLEIESAVGKGSRFTVWLPIAEAADPARRLDAHAAE